MISVIMSTYREPIEYIRSSISSILNQTYKDIELIIVFDDPKNMELIQFVSSLAEKDNRIRYYVNEKNMGLTASLNRAKRLANGEYIARMDADDISELDRLSCQLEYLQNGGYDLIGCNVIDIDENDKIINHIGTQYPTNDNSIKSYLKINSAIPHPTWLVRKTIYDNYDYIDFPACEDYEFLTRIALDGHRLGNLKECKLRYRINSKGISSNKKILQKTSFSYVRDNYRQSQKSNYDDFLVFLNSVKGTRKKNSLLSYYTSTARLKEYRCNHKRVHFILLGIRIFVTEPEGRKIVSNAVKGKLMCIMWGKKY